MLTKEKRRYIINECGRKLHIEQLQFNKEKYKNERNVLVNLINKSKQIQSVFELLDQLNSKQAKAC